MSPLEVRPLLENPDRRSIAESNRVLAAAIATPDLVAEIANLLDDPDALIQMRALDLLEKIAVDNPEAVQPYVDSILSFQSPLWEVDLQLARLLPRLTWNDQQIVCVIERLRKMVRSDQKLVRAWSLDGLATLSTSHSKLRPEVDELIADFLASPHGSLRARARAIAKRLG